MLLAFAELVFRGAALLLPFAGGFRGDAVAAPVPASASPRRGAGPAAGAGVRAGAAGAHLLAHLGDGEAEGALEQRELEEHLLGGRVRARA